jgi:hypothetical protein
MTVMTSALPGYSAPDYPSDANPSEWYSCTRKLYWGCETLAWNWATLLAMVFPHEDRPFIAYDCNYCDGWHVGHVQRSAA